MTEWLWVIVAELFIVGAWLVIESYCRQGP